MISLNSISPTLMVTCDPTVFKKYTHLTEESSDDVDVTLYLNQLTEEKINSVSPYTRLVFDQRESVRVERILEKEFGKVVIDVIKMHNPFDLNPRKFISERAFDNLYKNAVEVHPDRVHTCVAALTLGDRCKFHSPTARGRLHLKVVQRYNDTTKDINMLLERQFDILTD